MLLFCPQWLRKLMEFVHIPHSFRVFIAVASVVNALVSYFFERVVIFGIIENVITTRKLARREREKLR